MLIYFKYDQSSTTQYGYKIYGSGKDMGWENGLPKGADGSESLNLKEWVDFAGGLREGANFSDLLQEGKFKNIIERIEKIKEAISKTGEAIDGYPSDEKRKKSLVFKREDDFVNENKGSVQDHAYTGDTSTRFKKGTKGVDTFYIKQSLSDLVYKNTEGYRISVR